MKIEKIIINYRYLFLLFLTSFLPGCSDDNPVTTPTNIDVNGKVVTSLGVPVYGAPVIIGSLTTVTTADGSFVINDVTPPYDAKIIYNTNGILYEGISTASPVLNISQFLPSQNSAVLRIQIPPMVSGQRANIFFTDGSTTYNDGRIIFPVDTLNMTVRWNEANSITGKIIVLIGTYSGNAATSFDKYGEKTNFTLNSGGIQSLVFTSQELSLNPGESTVGGSVISSPPGLTFQSCSLLMTFGNNSPISVNTISFEPTNPFSFVVPTGLISIPRLYLFTFASNIASVVSANSAVVIPGSTGNSIMLENYSVLTFPPDNATNIDTNTNFIFIPGTGTGIYELKFQSGTRSFTIYTTSSDSVKIPNLSAYGLGMGGNTTYIWFVEKNLGFSSIDEFVSAPIYKTTKYTGYTRSEQWEFTTRP